MNDAIKLAIRNGQQAALARLREPGTEVPAPLAIPAGDELIEQVDSSWLDGVTIERVITLGDGEGIRGVFLGAGPAAELGDPVTGEMREIGTWRIEVRHGQIARILDSARLRADLRTMPEGARIRIARIGTIDTRRGRRVTDYLVARELGDLPPE